MCAVIVFTMIYDFHVSCCEFRRLANSNSSKLFLENISERKIGENDLKFIEPLANVSNENWQVCWFSLDSCWKYFQNTRKGALEVTKIYQDFDIFHRSSSIDNCQNFPVFLWSFLKFQIFFNNFIHNLCDSITWRC